ncbi:MAG: hypothetical protein R3255_01370 [Candidatus Lokiarchaeia archaeon]|nr:hypothetical protein [Candidatus Lokiarchaeia archaeon]
MKDLNDIPEFLKYFEIVKPLEIKINKENIFYREKYNDIMNYLKAMLTNYDDTVLNGYLEPKGTVLINISPGTDILDYIRLIAKNYYLDLIEFNETGINNNPNKFINSLISIFKVLNKFKEEEEDMGPNNRDPDKIEEKKLLLINQDLKFKGALDDKNLLEVLLNVWQNEGHSFNYIKSNIILVWVNYDMEDINEISSNLYEIFDLFIKIPLLSKIQRETVLKDYLEINPKIVFDVNDVLNYTENWEVNDIKQLLKVGIFKHFLNSELNETSNEITDVLIDLIESGEYIPIPQKILRQGNSKVQMNDVIIQNQKIDYEKETQINETPKDISSVIEGIRESRISDFMLNQLYEDAVSKNYTELTIIIDKLNKKEQLEENDLKLLAKYPFILNDSPNQAQINLEKAKKRIDLIKQAFGK